MSTRSKTKRATQRKPAQAPGRASKTAGTTHELELAQRRLDKAAEAFREAQEARRLAVRKAWGAGMPAMQLAGYLGVSRQKVYEIVGGVPRTKTGPST